MSEYIYEIDQLCCSYDKHFREGVSRVVLEIEHLVIPRGKTVFIVGESGIGKSTILETLGMMNNTIVPNNSTHFCFIDTDGNKTDLKAMWKQDAKGLANFRLKHYSFIFQSTNLMKNFTAFENIAFTRLLQGYSRFSCFQRTKQVLADLGLEHVDEERMAQELSGGQQQRLAFARAILPEFTVLFGDEPTGNLDAENAYRVMEILKRKLSEHESATAIIVSHDIPLALQFADVVIKIGKRLRPKLHEEDEDISYGYVDNNCIYLAKDNRQLWSNGNDKYDVADFEKYLRTK